jgi:hypothetical protein
MFEEKDTDREMFIRSSRLRGHPSLQPVIRGKQNLKKIFQINVTCCAVPLVWKIIVAYSCTQIYDKLVKTGNKF